jgi:hypothetical protein
MAQPLYSIDSSSLIHGWREAYFPENFEGFWEGLSELADNGVLVASKEVFLEIKRKDERLYQWCLEHKSMFIELDETQMGNLSTLMAKYPRFVDTRTGRNAADPLVITLATSCSPPLTVITQEGPGGTDEKPKIPFVCAKEKVPCINLAQLVQKEGWKFRR